MDGETVGQHQLSTIVRIHDNCIVEAIKYIMYKVYMIHVCDKLGHDRRSWPWRQMAILVMDFKMEFNSQENQSTNVFRCSDVAIHMYLKCIIIVKK